VPTFLVPFFVGLHAATLWRLSARAAPRIGGEVSRGDHADCSPRSQARDRART
jgi:hypothetical protein